jgi:RNA polymerase sigma-70 factor, ECF subfamily
MTEVLNDRRLAAACAAGEPSIFEEVYRLYGERMKSIAWNHLGNISDAEDAVQETFIKIHRGAASFTGDASFSTWAFKILINTCYDMLRKRQRRITEAPIDDSPAAAMRAEATVDVPKRMMLKKMLDALPEQKRTVFTLFEIDGLSHAEIGEILGISEGNSKWILFSTKKELQQQWKQS